MDEHELCRRGLCSILPHLSGVELIVEAGDARGAIQQARSAQPNLVITDLFFPGAGGVGLVRELKRTLPHCRILVLTVNRSEALALEAFQAGASGFALKEQKVDELVEAIRAVVRGEVYLAPHFPRTILDPVPLGASRALRAGPLGDLSAREREVFDLAVRAFTNDGIATELGISVKTVETHRARINRKLRVHSTAELVRFAALNDLLAKRPD